MVKRLQKLSKNNSLFLFGARGTGKTTLLTQMFGGSKALWINLLKDEDESRFGRFPDELSHVLTQDSFDLVIIDEVQKAPKILDIVHLEMEKRKNIQFVLTGSSARKLKRGAANLLAGRAFSYQLYPLTHFELGKKFDLQEALEFGTLPKLLELPDLEDKKDFLRTYVKTYLKEEIQVEQLVRNLNPFRDFLEVAAQCNGKILNYSKIARDVGVDDKTIRNYFSILEDTLLGFQLSAYHRSIRKQQRESSKFYFFDSGVVRALAGVLRVPLMPRTYAFGEAFEHWVVLEAFRLNEYKKFDYKFSYLRTKDGAEIDLIIRRPGEVDLLVEIKSAKKITEEMLTNLKRFKLEWGAPCETQLWSLDHISKNISGISCLPWQKALSKLYQL